MRGSYLARSWFQNKGKLSAAVLIFLLFIPLSAESDALTEEGFDLFYNYKFDQTDAWLEQQALNSDMPLKYNMFRTYNTIRGSLANGNYEGLNDKIDSMIAAYEPSFKAYLRIHPEDVDVQFYHAALLGGKMRLHLHNMSYLEIIKDAPSILLVKGRIDRYSDDFPDIYFGTGCFQYYMSQFIAIRGLLGTMQETKQNGLADLWKCYLEGSLAKWESAIVLMYVTLYDEMNMTLSLELGETFLKRFPNNLEMLALYIEALFYNEDDKMAESMLEKYEELTHSDLLGNNKNAIYRLTYLYGVEAMMSQDYEEALNYFSSLEGQDMEYSWYSAIIQKYMGDICLEMGDVSAAKLHYQKTVDTRELISHVIKAKSLLKELR